MLESEFRSQLLSRLYSPFYLPFILRQGLRTYKSCSRTCDPPAAVSLSVPSCPAPNCVLKCKTHIDVPFSYLRSSELKRNEPELSINFISFPQSKELRSVTGTFYKVLVAALETKLHPQACFPHTRCLRLLFSPSKRSHSAIL